MCYSIICNTRTGLKAAPLCTHRCLVKMSEPRSSINQNPSSSCDLEISNSGYSLAHWLENVERQICYMYLLQLFLTLESSSARKLGIPNLHTNLNTGVLSKSVLPLTSICYWILFPSERQQWHRTPNLVTKWIGHEVRVYQLSKQSIHHHPSSQNWHGITHSLPETASIQYWS